MNDLFDSPSVPWIRLGCICCDRDDYDEITEAELAALKLTWKDILEYPENGLLDWQTHMGLCPECKTE